MTRHLRILLLAAAALGVTATAFVLPPSGRVEGQAAEVTRSLETGPDGLRRFNRLALADPDTSLVDGGPEQGQATYATRARSLMFLADTYYTTATLDGSVLTLSAPSAFRRAGLEANRERLEFWIGYLAAQDG